MRDHVSVLEELINYVGQAAVNAVTRLMGLILAVIGTQLAIKGIVDTAEAIK